MAHQQRSPSAVGEPQASRSSMTGGQIELRLASGALPALGEPRKAWKPHPPNRTCGSNP
ncbi:MAG: hypothetical protein BJ554DRAFT_4464 [Olpidium bornovanus]|uniref:Uncharacterized protein n=1 Tax=Olpidium bornovanus TaxID=278681 RepID=A0A8H8A2Y6_9FUNG|nr:MAG: hypothetical protein BJ554DRAFT_4464 [Olpidium bornovanus]